MSDKSTTDKAKSKVKPTAQPAQPTGETAPNTPPTTPAPEQHTTPEMLTDEEAAFILKYRNEGKLAAMMHLMDTDIKEIETKRDERIDEAAAELKAHAAKLEDVEDIDKVIDLIGRVTGDGGYYKEIKGRRDSYTFRQLSLHLALDLWRDWFDFDELFEERESEHEKCDLSVLVPYIDRQIWAAIDNYALDENSVLNWINSLDRQHHAEWVDGRGVPMWMGSKSLKMRLESEAAQDDEAESDDSEGGDDE